MGIYFAFLIIARVSGKISFEQAFFGEFYWPNEIAILGALSIQVSDWLFTEQYLLAALNLPIVIFIFEESSTRDFETDGYGSRFNPIK